MIDPITDINCSRGAPMGRADIHGIPDSVYKFRLHKVALDSGGYDRGGAYWGHGGPGPLYVAYAECDPRYSDLFPRLFLRAPDREAAKDYVRDEYPNATFYR